MADDRTTVAELKKLMADFVTARNWDQFHDPKNLSTSIAIEAAELMEHFQWVNGNAADEMRNDTRQMSEVAEEVADILAYLVSFASRMEIDLSEALAAKMKKNEAKYPVDQFYGKFRRAE